MKNLLTVCIYSLRKDNFTYTCSMGHVQLHLVDERREISNIIYVYVLSLICLMDNLRISDISDIEFMFMSTCLYIP